MTVASVYDGAGSLLKETFSRLGIANKEVNYAWGSEGTLSSISYKNLNRPAFMPEFADNTIAFVYDDFGNRVKKSANGSAGSYYLNDGLTVLDELDADGNVEKTMVKGVGPVAEIGKDGIIQYVHTDVLGSAVLLTNGEGKVAHQYEYEAFGRMASDIGSASDETNYTFTNQEFDPESDLYYYNARYYNPRLGRFISRDTVLGHAGDTLSRNLYIYVKNNPLKYTDPTGNFNWTALGTGLLEVGKTVLDLGACVGEAVLSGMAIPVQPGASVVLFGGAVANLDNAMVDSTNALNNIVNAFRDKPAEKMITQGPYRDFAESILGDTQLVEMAQIGGDTLSFGVKDVPKYLSKIVPAYNIFKNAKASGVGGASAKYIAKQTSNILWEGANVVVETLTGGEDIIDLFESGVISSKYNGNK